MSQGNSADLSISAARGAIALAGERRGRGRGSRAARRSAGRSARPQCISRLRDRDPLEGDRAVCQVVELVGLRDPGRRDHIHRLGTVPGSTVQCGSTFAWRRRRTGTAVASAAKPRAWSGLNPSWPVRTTVKPQPGPGRAAEARRRDAEGDEARHRVGADRDRPERGAVRVDVALAEALHLEQPAPGAPGRDRVVALQERGRRRGVRRRRGRVVDVDVDELRAERAAERRRSDRGSAARRSSLLPSSKTWKRWMSKAPAWKSPEVG